MPAFTHRHGNLYPILQFLLTSKMWACEPRRVWVHDTMRIRAHAPELWQPSWSMSRVWPVDKLFTDPLNAPISPIQLLSVAAPAAASCGGNRLQRLQRCKMEAYCSRACQRTHWSVHKKYCQRGRRYHLGVTGEGEICIDCSPRFLAFWRSRCIALGRGGEVFCVYADGVM